MTSAFSVDPAVLTPAALVCARFGGAAKLARLLGVPHSTPWRWLRSEPSQTTRKPTRGLGPLGGQIPAQYQRQILALAREHKVRLSPKEMIEGGAP